ncbi:MAG: histidinol dehydrogenase [Myxococcota bacterium]|jgi:histidinol dehydrogenase|nr:histidinol dehydrogenase [Myxococcota bacterium]
MAGKSSTKLMRILKADEDAFAQEWKALCDRTREVEDDFHSSVVETIGRIREEGDAAIRSFLKADYDATPESIEVTRDEWDAACEAVDPVDRAAIGKAAMRIRAFHRKRVPSSWEMREEGGAYMGHRVRPLDTVGLYIPRSETVHPSRVIMYVTPASVVEVPEIVLATAPDAEGNIAPEVLMAARVAGVHRVFKVGGAAAIASMAIGTRVVPRVDKVVGPGERAANYAKHLLMGDVGIDSPVGESELCVVADASATPAWVAADMLSQAERSVDSQQILITHSKSIASRVHEQMARQMKGLEGSATAKQALGARGAIIVTKNQAASIELANQYASERLVLALKDADAAHKLVRNAGAVLLGHYTPVAVGDYIAGPNHVLPTGGAARFGSPLGVDDFLKRTAFVRFEPPKLRELGAEVIRLGEVEGVGGAGKSVDLRLQKIRRVRREREAAREAEL